MGIALGLVAALCWGSGDFLARFATLRTGFLRTLIVLQIVSGTLVGGVMLARGDFRLLTHQTIQVWLLAVVTALLNVLSSLALYRAIEVGPLSIVAPITATYAAVTVALALLTGEQVAPIRGGGIVLAVVGVGLSSLAPSSPPRAAEQAPLGRLREVIVLATLASIGYGVSFWLLGRAVTPALGQLAPTWIIRVVSLVVLLGVALVTHQPLRLAAGSPRGATLGLIALVALIDTAAYEANFFGYQSDAVAIVTVMASLYGMVTVALARIFLRERLAPIQWSGIAIIFIGIFLVSLRGA